MRDLIFSVSRLRLIPPSAGWGHTQRDRRRLHDVSPAWTQRAWISWGAASQQRFHVSWSSRWLVWVWIVSWASESRAAVQLCDDFPHVRSVLDPARHLPEPSSWCGADGSESVKSNRVWWCTCSERVAARGAFQWVWAEFKPEEWRSCVRDNGEIVFSSLDINLRPCCCCCSCRLLLVEKKKNDRLFWETSFIKLVCSGSCWWEGNPGAVGDNISEPDGHDTAGPRDDDHRWRRASGGQTSSWSEGGRTGRQRDGGDYTAFNILTSAADVFWSLNTHHVFFSRDQSLR